MQHKPLLGVLGGSFDPIHIGHLRVAIEVQSALQLTALLIIPCHQSPLRALPSALGHHRLAMAHLSVKPLPNITVEPFEVKRPRVSYTLTTLKALAHLYPDYRLCFIMGMDVFLHFCQWSDWKNIMAISHLIVVTRPGYPYTVPLPPMDQAMTLSLLHDNPSGFYYIQDIHPLAVSSTYIRNIIKEGGNPHYLLPDLVYNYIKKYNLYSS